MLLNGDSAFVHGDFTFVAALNIRFLLLDKINVDVINSCLGVAWSENTQARELVRKIYLKHGGIKYCLFVI